MKLRWAGAMAWGLSAMGLLACVAGLRAIAPRFTYGSEMTERPIVWLTALLMAGALPYLYAVFLARRFGEGRGRLAVIIAVGLALRLLMAPAQPMLEDDFYRYLWDGAMVSHGYNPFVHIPEEVQEGAEGVPPELVALGAEAGIILERVNHPHLATIYPTVAQAAFAAAHWLRPWSLAAWKLVLFYFDAVTLALLLLLLRQFKLPLALCVIYWWNPLLIKETYNSAHMDVLILPPLMGALLLSARQRPVGAMVCLALAVCTKLWPVLLAPLLLWKYRHAPKRWVPALLVFAFLTAGLLWPLYAAHELGDDSGIVAYSESWEMNDALYMVLPWSAERLSGLFGARPTKEQLHLIARGTILLLLGGLVLWVTIRHGDDARSRCGAALAVVAALYLISPTQYPWYSLWLLPLLTVRPTWSLLGFTLTLPLYYLKFHYAARDNVDFFHYRVVWIEHGPVLLLLAVELALQARRGRTRTLTDRHGQPAG